MTDTAFTASAADTADRHAAVLVGPDAAPTRLGDSVVQRLTQAILDGRLKPGDDLPAEGRIAAAFSVSKQVAREAIRELAAAGVVHVRQGRPTQVRDLGAEPLGRFYRFAVRGSRRGLAEVVEMRRLLEPPLARLAAERADAAACARLTGALARMRAAIGDIPPWIEADLDFHEALADAAANRLLALQARGLRPVITEVMVMFNARLPRQLQQWQATFRRHEVLAEAVQAGDPAAAEAAMTRHFEAAEEAIREIFPRTQ